MTDSSPHLDQMRRTLEQQVRMTAEDWDLIAPELNVIEVPAKHTLQRAGDIVRQHYFIVNGLVRLFYPTLDGKELNKGFYDDHYIVGSLSAVILNEPARFGVETLEPCTLIELPLKKLSPLYQAGTSWERLFNHSCKMMLIRNERREAELLTLSAKQRFQQFCRNFPDYQSRIPQYHIASYLGITPVALSKYKKQWLSDTPQNKKANR